MDKFKVSIANSLSNSTAIHSIETLNGLDNTLFMPVNIRNSST